MATKKKTKKKLLKKKASPKKKLPKKKPTAKAAPRKPAARKPAPAPPSKKRSGSQRAATPVFPQRGESSAHTSDAGDLQGLSSAAGADSESVDELLDEGNAFEAEVVKGVEDADDADEAEVHTHEVPEDDVPEEYLDKDS
jgi:hypothetical protein